MFETFSDTLQLLQLFSFLGQEVVEPEMAETGGNTMVMGFENGILIYLNVISYGSITLNDNDLKMLKWNPEQAISIDVHRH